MKWNWNAIWDSKWFYRALALLLAIGLFAYVHVENFSNTRQTGKNNTTITATTKRTLKVPLQLNADTDKYFITGYPEKVSVEIEGSNSLVTVTANTVNFRIIADLSKLGVGTHRVKLKEEGLNKDLTYSIKPKTIKVKIQDRKTKTMPIQVKYNKDSIAQGYSVGTPKLSASTAEVTGAKGEINRVYQVVANVVLKRNTKDDVSQQVILQALDAKGGTVNVVVSPETVTVKLPVTLPSKQVDVTLKQKGTAASDTDYTLSTATKTVTIYGNKDVLDQIDSLTIPVDISGITKDTTKSYNVTDVGSKLVAASPSAITVKIKANSTTDAADATTSSSSASSSSSSAASSSSSDGN